jgi:hypothetical protein
MRGTLSSLAATALLAVAAAPVTLASVGTPVSITGSFLVFGTTQVQEVSADPSGILCPVAMSEIDSNNRLPAAAGPDSRGASATFVGTAIRTVYCVGDGWSAADSYTVRFTLKGNNDGLTADGTWAIVGATGRLEGLHGSGDLLSTLAYFPVVTEYFTGTIHLDPA